MSKCSISKCSKNTESSYVLKVLEILGPIILGSKPAEIINISVADIHKENKLQEIQEFFINCCKISYKVINIEDGSYRILFYNESKLKNVFTKKSINFLKFLGYPKDFNYEKYMQVLINKLHSKDFPHEIGIFLGYPLKDVVGFMGYGNYPFVKTKGWRIYGDADISDNLITTINSDRERFKAMIIQNDAATLRSII